VVISGRTHEALTAAGEEVQATHLGELLVKGKRRSVEGFVLRSVGGYAAVGVDGAAGKVGDK
jgi:hypothetical protein